VREGFGTLRRAKDWTIAGRLRQCSERPPIVQSFPPLAAEKPSLTAPRADTARRWDSRESHLLSRRGQTGRRASREARLLSRRGGGFPRSRHFPGRGHVLSPARGPAREASRVRKRDVSGLPAEPRNSSFTRRESRPDSRESGLLRSREAGIGGISEDPACSGSREGGLSGPAHGPRKTGRSAGAQQERKEQKEHPRARGCSQASS